MTTDVAGMGAEMAPDPAAAAARVLEQAGEGEPSPAPPRRRGRPPGKKTSTARTRAFRERQRDGGKTEAGPPAEIVVDEGDIASSTALGQTVWDLVGPMFRLRSLDEAQSERLGRALAPLVKKYLPLLADWQHEINFALVVFALARENAVPKPVPSKLGTVGDGTVQGE